MDEGNHWHFTYDAFVPEKEMLREALCTLGNGYFATRGANLEAKADDVHYPGTYLAGGYNRLGTEIAGRVIENEDLVNVPNWLYLNFRIDDGEWFQLKAVELLSYKQLLNVKEGTLSREIHLRDAHGRETSLIEKRFVHMKKYHIAAIERTIIPENWSGKVEIRSALDGCVKNTGVKRYRELNHVHLEPLETDCFDNRCMLLKVQTNQSGLKIAQAARTKIFLNGELIVDGTKDIQKPGYVAQDFSLDVSKGDTVSVEKIVAMYTSRDHAISECSLEAKDAVINTEDFKELLSLHINVWDSYWNEFDIEIEVSGNQLKSDSQLILRLHIFHLLQTVNMNTIDLDVGVPARGWHGEAYRGHIFWDELYIFPTLNLRMPKITLALLKYRYRRLDEARRAAREEGFSGAMFPWQSGSNGREESQKVHLNPVSGRWIPDHSHIQRHVNLAIAYNVWSFYQITGDIAYLRSFGAELIIEIARFLSSLCTYNTKHKKYEILGVMGPDEYHDAYPDSDKPGLDNNTYTNLMTVWVLCRVLKMMEILPEDHQKELKETLDIQDSELELWEKISRNMRVVFHGDGILSQFEGYEKLKEFSWEQHFKKYGDIQRLDRILEDRNDSTNNYQVSKQADVLMLFYLFSADEIKELLERLGYSFDPSLIPKNIDYYLNRTSHGSTLSRLVHSWVLSRRNRAGSWELFLHALESDVADIQGGTTPEGIHLGAMAGTVDLVQRCYGGIEARGEVLWFDPCLPDAIQKLRFHVHYRGHSLEVELDHKKLKIVARYTTAEKIKVGYKAKVYELVSGQTKEFKL